MVAGAGAGAQPEPGRRSQAQNLSVGKAAAILRAVADHPDGLSVAALARVTGIPRPTARRLVDGLAAERLLVRLRDHDQILLGSGLLELARRVPRQRLLIEAAQAPLETLVSAVNESASLVVAQADGTLTGILHIHASRRLRPASWTGQTWSPYPSASGRVLLSWLPASELERFLTTVPNEGSVREELRVIRARGYAYSADELEEGLAVLAAPVLREGALEAIVTVSAPVSRLPPETAERIAPAVLHAAREIAAANVQYG